MIAKSFTKHPTRFLANSNLHTHTVFNQSSPLVNFNLFTSDPALVTSFPQFYGTDDKGKLSSALKLLENFGDSCGRQDMMDTADLAERNRPVLRQFDNYGRRIDVIDYHSSYHDLMRHAIESGVVSYGFNKQEKGSHLVRAALIYMENQLEPGHCCPLVMTQAAIPVLKRLPQMNYILDKIYASNYDPSNKPIEEKLGVTIGMSMTEKQGGSDVRSNTTTAKPVNPQATCEGSPYLLTGHKWFTSAPMSDAYLTLATASDTSAPSCFLVPRWLPDGSRNSGFQVMRLKDKLADRANASSEVEYRDAYGVMLGAPGKGVKTIIEMVQSTRLDCTLGSAATNRRALQLALNHTSERSAFGHRLIDQPLMRSVLADLCIESEAHTLTAMRMAAAFDRYYDSTDSADEQEKNTFRIGVTVSKYFVTKRSPAFVYECMETMGGNGFVEDFPMAKLFRHSPLNSIWEGSGNVIALDILRGFAAVPALMADISSCRGADSRLDSYVQHLERSLMRVGKDPLSAGSQRAARNLVDRLAVAMQASIMIRFGDARVAQAFLASRLGLGPLEERGVNFGGAHVFSKEESDYLLSRNMPISSV